MELVPRSGQTQGSERERSLAEHCATVECCAGAVGLAHVSLCVRA